MGRHRNDGLRVLRHHLVDNSRHQIGPPAAAQVAVGDDADDLAGVVDDADAAKPLRRDFLDRFRHAGAERLEGDCAASVHDIARRFQHRAELAAGVEVGEFHRGEAATFKERNGKRIAERELHQ